MDSRVKLTRKQKGLIKQLGNLFNKLKKENVGMLAEFSDYSFDGFIFYNETEALDTDVFQYDSYSRKISEDYCEESENGFADENTIWYTPDPSDVERLQLRSPIDLYDDNWFSILLERDEKVDIFLKKKEKQEKLAPLKEKMVKLEKELEEYKQAVTSGEDSVKRLEEKQIAQEIIDEEKANIASNNNHIDELQKEISELCKEIRKVNAIKIR